MNILDILSQIVVMLEQNKSLISLLISLILLIILIIGGNLSKRFIFSRKNLNIDVKNGLIILITLSQVLIGIDIIFGLLSLLLPIDFTMVIALLTIMATAIGAASTSVSSNIIGGFYILLTKPFNVGDFIKIQKIEGIVKEISLNFTTLTRLDSTNVIIPNGNLVNSSLLNFNVKLKARKFEQERETSNKIKKKTVIRYRNRLELKLDVIDPPIQIECVNKRLNKVCEDFTKNFGYRPRFYFGRYEFRQELFLEIFSRDPFTIFNVWPFFIEALATNVYKELQKDLSL